MLLKNSRCYLAGPVEFSQANWRSFLKPKLENFNMTIYDPVERVNQLIRVDGNSQTTHRHHFNEFYSKDHPRDFDEILEKNKAIRTLCLRLVAGCDFVICKIDGFTVGTFEEIKNARDQNKPVLFLTGNVPIDSMWRVAQFVDSDDGLEDVFFNSEDKLIEYLNDINYGFINERDKIKWATILK